MAGTSDVHWFRAGIMSIHSHLYSRLTLNRPVTCWSPSSGEEHGYTKIAEESSNSR